MENQKNRDLNDKFVSRRKLLKIIAAAGGAMATSSSLPQSWVRPVVEVGLLPAHAFASAPTPGPTPTPTTVASEPTVEPPPLGNEFAVMGTVDDGNRIVVFPTANTNLPTPTQENVSNLPADAKPHGVSYFGEHGGLISDFSNARIFVVDLSSNKLTDTISTASAGYNGMGTIAAAPGSGYALACGSSSKLIVIKAPFAASSNITSVTLPGTIASYQTQSIVFNAAKRAFVYHTTGISVLDPPYTQIEFTIPFNNATTGLLSSGAIAISPDGKTLLATTFDENVYIFDAPFSSSTTPKTLSVGDSVNRRIKLGLSSNDTTPIAASAEDIDALQGDGLDGINIAPDGKKALVCTAVGSPKVFAISAPFKSNSKVEEIPLPSLTSRFEDIGISPDSKLAIVTGNSVHNGAPAIFIRAPFTAKDAEVFAVDIIGGGRGAGAVRFQPPNT
ncbi:MAG: twin-arginine translocation signal domain-containing protein [Anaerolineae bacterium]|nr:twin-arginine translocation signal domain-containing protein [Anaerolineae bacterium]